MRNQIGVVVDVGQTCVRCAKYRRGVLQVGNDRAKDGEFFCMEYERFMVNPRYICKNFKRGSD